MKKFEFTLGKLLHYKDQVLETEKNTLKQRQQEKNQIEQKIKDYTEELFVTDKNLKEQQRKGITISKVRLYEYQIDNLRYQLKQLKMKLRLAEIEVEKQVKVVVSASQEVNSLEKLQAKQYEEYQKEVARADESLISEFVSAKLARESVS